MKNKAILTLLLVLGAFPLLAQVNNAGKQPLQTQVENAVLRTQAQQKLIEPTEDDPYLLIRAEELWQADRNIHSGYPKHDLKYYYNWLLEQEKAEVAKAHSVHAANSYPLETDPRLLIRAEELLQDDRNAHNGNAVHSLEHYYNLLLATENYAASTAQPADISPQKGPAAETEELSLQEQIEAETELAHIRNTWDMNATFEKYPYLMSPSYRRAGEEGKRSIRRQYTNPSWTRSVGL